MFLELVSVLQKQRRESHALDNGREEEREAVNWAKPSHADEHEDINFPVANGLPNIFHIEIVGQMTVVLF